jgi:hypothetical protein
VKHTLKYLFALVVTIYLASNTGIPVYYHYCGGELESVSTLFKSSSCCGDDEDEDSGCCQNETKVFAQKSETSFQSDHFKLIPASLSLMACAKTEYFFPGTNAQRVPILHKHFFPPGCGRDILQQSAVLII